MRLFQKIILTVLIPVILLLILAIAQSQNLINKIEQGIEEEYVHDALLATQDIERISEHFRYIADIMASSRDVVNALENADNDYLSEMGALFLDERVDNIIFTDVDGIVLARFPDEFRFGDNLKNKFYFKRLKESGRYYGVSVIDGTDSIVYASYIKKYGDLPVGVVIVSVSIGDAFMEYLNKDRNGIISYSSGGENLSNINSDQKVVSSMNLGSLSDNNEINDVNFVMNNLENKNYIKMRKLKSSVLTEFVVMIILLPIFLLFTIKYHLRPYGKVVKYLISFVDEDKGIPYLNSKLKKLEVNKKHEINGVVSGVLAMTSLLAKNMNLLTEKNKELEKISKTDTLTKVSNRLHIDNILVQELVRVSRYDAQLSLIMVDLDYFKTINDTHGHQVGDNVLVEFADLLIQNTRATDIVGRWGGEEFMIVCPGIECEQAKVLAEKIKEILNTVTLGGLKVTASFGIAMYVESDTVHSLVKRADEALYTAKDAGRNCVMSDCDIAIDRIMV